MPTRTATRPSRAGRIRRRPNGNANNAGVPASARSATTTPPRIRKAFAPRGAAALVSLCLLVLAAPPAARGSPAAAVIRGRRPGRGADRRGGSRAPSPGRERRRLGGLGGRPHPAGRALDEWDDAVDDDEFNSDLEDEAAGLAADDEFAYGDGGDGGDAASAATAPGPAPPGGYAMDDPAALEAEAARHEGDFAPPPAAAGDDDVLSDIAGVEEELEELEAGGGDDDETVEREEELYSLEEDLIDEAIEGGKIDPDVISEIAELEEQIDELEANANDDAATLEKEEELSDLETDLLEGAIDDNSAGMRR